MSARTRLRLSNNNQFLHVLKYTPKINYCNYSLIDYSPSGHHDCRQAERNVIILCNQDNDIG